MLWSVRNNLFRLCDKVVLQIPTSTVQYALSGFIREKPNNVYVLILVFKKFTLAFITTNSDLAFENTILSLLLITKV